MCSFQVVAGLDWLIQLTRREYSQADFRDGVSQYGQGPAGEVFDKKGERSRGDQEGNKYILEARES